MLQEQPLRENRVPGELPAKQLAWEAPKRKGGSGCLLSGRYETSGKGHARKVRAACRVDANCKTPASSTRNFLVLRDWGVGAGRPWSARMTGAPLREEMGINSEWPKRLLIWGCIAFIIFFVAVNPRGAYESIDAAGRILLEISKDIVDLF